MKSACETVKAKADIRPLAQSVRGFQMTLVRHQEQLWRAALIVLAVALTGVVFSRTNVPQVVATLQQVSLPWLLVSIVAYGAQTWVMARRYWLLLGKRPGFHQLLALVIMQSSLGNLITTSSGAVSYVAVLRARYGVPIARSVASMFVARLGDALVLFSVLALSGWIVWSPIEPLHALVVGLCVLAAAGLVVLLGLYRTRHWSTEWAGRLLNHGPADETHWCIRLKQRLSSLGIAQLGQGRITVGQGMGYWSLYFLLNLAFAYGSAQAFSLAIGIGPVMFMLALTEIVSFIPLQVFGGLGVYDVSLLYLYGLFGFAPSELAATILSMRLLFYGVNLLLLCLAPRLATGVCALGARRRRSGITYTHLHVI